DRLLEGLETVDFSDSMKEMQRNWIGKSEGAEIDFAINGTDSKLRVYTTRPDTIFGVDFMVIAPEHELIGKITTPEQQTAVDDYLKYVKSRSERERLAEAKTVTGCFTGAYAINPFDGRKIPVWTAEYVLAGYGTGAIMAVPCGDQRDFLFATHFNIPITNIIGAHFNGQEANPTKEAILENSGFLNGLLMKDAIGVAVNKIEELGIGKRKVNYKMRDAGFSRQRYWGEPFPIVWKDDIAIPLEEKDLPLELPHVDKYGPGPNGEGPLANLSDWLTELPPTLVGGRRETSTMPGYAGSSWYFLRYMDPHNNQTFCDRKVSDYWNQVDLYIGGTEHAVGHLLYSRMWTKVLFDLGLIGYDEPFKRLLNQGMIQGSSRIVYRIAGTNQFVSAGKQSEYEVQPLHVDVNIVDGVQLDIEAFKKWKPEFADAEFIFEDGTFSLSCSTGSLKDMKYICGVETEKMSKRYFNTVDPRVLCDKYGADTFRMYEMFLGPVEASKPWDTKGIEGVHRFLRKLWRLFNDDVKGKIWTTEKATDAELKVLHRTIKKIEEDTERFSFNTAVST
ncbi:MAG TPA: class I tRNA ligase family protein, partial [Ferruginibacter sp.]|nr:class I tRNA ligase family protein [Ferruginibacter sp.]